MLQSSDHLEYGSEFTQMASTITNPAQHLWHAVEVHIMDVDEL